MGSGKVTGEKRTEAADGEVTVRRREGVEVGFVVQFGEVTAGGERVERHLRGLCCSGAERRRRAPERSGYGGMRVR